MKQKITKTLIEEIIPKTESYEIYDTEIKGFLVRILPSGTATYMLAYRWHGKKTRVTIGRCTVLKTAQAREAAKNLLADLTKGIDPGEKKRELKKPVPAAAVRHTLKSFIDDEYQSWCEAHKDDGVATVKRIRAAFKDFLDTPLTEIDSLAASRWRTKRLEAGKAATTINRDINALRSLFSTAVEWKYIHIHPLEGFQQLPDKGIPLTRYLSNDEESRLYEALEAREQEKSEARNRGDAWREKRGYPPLPTSADPLLPMVVVSLNTGIRWGALTQLKWPDIDFDKQILTIRKEIEKTKQNRYMPLNSKVVAALEEWKKVNTKGNKTNQSQELSGLIFPSRDDEVRDNVKKSWAGVKARANITNFRWHDLRHTFASKLVMRGVDLNTVRELMGHSDIKMTLRYAHLAPEHKAAAVAVLV